MVGTRLEMTTISTKELAEALGVSEQAVRKRAVKQGWQVTGRAKVGGKTYDLAALPLTDDERRKVEGWRQLKALPALTPSVVEEALQLSGEADPAKALALAGERLPVAAQQQRALTGRQEKGAYHRYELVRLYLAHLAAAERKRKTEARDEFVVLYLGGAWPDLLESLGPVSWKTIEHWKLKVKLGNGDPCRLADTRGAHRKGLVKITAEQVSILRSFAFHPNKMKVSHAIRWSRVVMAARGIDTVSDITCRRYLERLRKADYATWTLFREGEQELENECGYTLDRDWSRANVGDVVTADGHVLNFQVINPYTGKPCRPTLLLWYDCRSNMPLGWEIMPTENTEVIHVALRRAILALGKVPKMAYLDNGRAFKGQYFNGSKDFEGDITGLYARLGIQTTFATAYHGQAKTVERFFGTMLEIESLMPSYTGNSIGNKPARMHRGERLHIQLWERFGNGDAALTLEQAHMILAAWFDWYAARPSRSKHLKGKTPLEVFQAGRGPGVDADELALLMMAAEIKRITKEGVYLLGEYYYHPALYGLREQVVVRYDLRERGCVYIYRQDGEFLGKGLPRAKVHPMARLLGTDEDKALLEQELATKNRMKSLTVGPAKQLLRDTVLPEHGRHLAQIGLIAPADGQPGEKPAKAVRAKAINFEAVQRESEAAMRRGEEAKARETNAELMRLSEPDRYERMLELQAQGVTVDEQWNGFMEMFEKTAAYMDYKEFWQERRLSIGLLHRTAVGGNR
jgi:putative transposase